MARTFGAVDKGVRKTRKDKGKRRKYYRGKPIKGKRYKAFQKRIGNKEYIKIWVWQELPMSEDGYRRWSRNVRGRIKRVIYKPIQVHLVHTSEIDTFRKIEEFMEMNYWAGTFIIKGFSNASNKFHCKAVRMCRVVIREKDYGLKAKLKNNYRLGRYSWFFKDR
jgi:hypothetical protein